MSKTRKSDGAGRREPPLDFIRTIVRDDMADGKHPGGVVTRFPPEPNGFLHIGHAKSICLNFGVAREFGGQCNLRFDDTDPAKEDTLFVEAIKDNIRWLGFDWGEGLYNASDYFEELYGFAVQLIERGGAYVCSLSEAEIRETRGTVTEPGRESPYRGRTAEENLEFFARMRDGEFPDGAHVLRARIDMASPNMKMRDPVIYRIRHVTHHHTGDAWPIYPMYDFAHPLSDALEGVTHSLCTLEFENNREFYDWILEQVDVPSNPRQIEFARLNLDYTVMSKRRLLELVEEKHVEGWDDPRMPTLAGLRRRGYTPEAIRNFCHSVGIAKSDNTVEMGQLEYFIRDDLNRKAPRVLAVERPLKVVLTNYPEGRVEELEAPYFPHDVPREGSRALPFSRELYIERDDFLEEPPRGISPAGAGPRGAAPLRLHHPLRRSRQGPGHRRGDGAALLLRPGDPERLRQERQEGAGHHPVGLRGACAGSRIAALRPALLRAGSPGRRGAGLPGAAKSEVPGNGQGPRGAGVGSLPGGRPVPVRALGIFLRRRRFGRGRARVQPHRDAP